MQNYVPMGTIPADVVSQVSKIFWVRLEGDTRNKTMLCRRDRRGTNVRSYVNINSALHGLEKIDEKSVGCGRPGLGTSIFAQDNAVANRAFNHTVIAGDCNIANAKFLTQRLKE